MNVDNRSDSFSVFVAIFNRTSFNPLISLLPAVVTTFNIQIIMKTPRLQPHIKSVRTLKPNRNFSLVQIPFHKKEGRDRDNKKKITVYAEQYFSNKHMIFRLINFLFGL